MRLTVFAAALALLPAAGPPPPGASGCSGCHGEAMPLAGRSAAETVEAMAAFRFQQRPATVMDRIAAGFTPAETAAIAAWWEDRQ